MTRAELDQRIKERMHQKIVADGVRLVDRAKRFAIQAHGDQKYGDLPYSVHLESVETVLIEFGHISSVMRAAAWLHDVLEDTETTEAQLVDANIPHEVISLVQSVTSEPGKNRKERNAATYPKIARNLYAVALKLADRIANVRNATASGSDLLKMYKKEYPEFRAALIGVRDITLTPMWWTLDRLLDYQGV